MSSSSILNYQETVEIVFEEAEAGEPVNAFELGYFLYYFRAAYVACLTSIESKDVQIDEAIALAKGDLLAPLTREVTTLWLANLSHEVDLEFLTISKQSPLRLGSKVVGACLTALVMAVILSGGEANVYTGEFKLPPIAHGIRQLKEAFRQEQPRELPSERRSSSRESGT
jgi:hypothetical protein